MGRLMLCGLLAAFLCSAHALVCPDNNLKVTVKVTSPDQFDQYEQYLFQGTLAYAIRKYCSVADVTDCKEGNVNMTDTVNVHLSSQTDRFSMCVAVDSASLVLIEDSIRQSRDRFDGALELTEDTLVISGVPPTLKPETVPDFPIWLIPFIVITCLVVLAAVAILGYTVYQSKPDKTKLGFDEDSLGNSDDEGIDSNAYVHDNDVAAARTAL